MDVDRLTSGPATYWENPVRYCVNELQSIRATLSASTGRPSEFRR